MLAGFILGLLVGFPAGGLIAVVIYRPMLNFVRCQRDEARAKISDQ